MHPKINVYEGGYTINNESFLSPNTKKHLCEFVTKLTPQFLSLSPIDAYSEMVDIFYNKSEERIRVRDGKQTHIVWYPQGLTGNKHLSREYRATCSINKDQPFYKEQDSIVVLLGIIANIIRDNVHCADDHTWYKSLDEEDSLTQKHLGRRVDVTMGTYGLVSVFESVNDEYGFGVYIQGMSHSGNDWCLHGGIIISEIEKILDAGLQAKSL